MAEQKDFASIGDIRISEDVIASIAALAVAELDGVTLVPAITATDLREIIGKTRLNRGIRVRIADTGITLDVQITVRYGLVVSELARKVQESVSNAVESMTALHVDAVNVNVAGIETEQKA
ncbi:MAG: Asp23/Gls24 family envelope stress response protein [Ruminococcaceae bacterium]|nr:Asp23/Gls24 family envelope stress response protein [Oscillospiraceae bacterium]